MRLLQKGKHGNGPVVYWMSRDQRIDDNWALVHSINLAKEKKRPLVIAFTLATNFLDATLRQYDFMLKGLQETEKKAKDLNIPLLLLIGENPPIMLSKFIESVNAHSVIADFDPLKIKRTWKRDLAKTIFVPFFEVDAHNIVPCLHVSNKQEFAAYTIRPKIQKILEEFLDDFPEITRFTESNLSNFNENIDWENLYDSLDIDRNVKPVEWLQPGAKNGFNKFIHFVENKLNMYAKKRNDPNVDALSDLSPYLHFGQISAQRVALEIIKNQPKTDNSDAFLEELIVRRELSDNFCYFNKNYHSFEGFPDWSKKTLNEHRKDEREYTYMVDDWEQANTHDDLWNAAQAELKNSGKLHGYMRMYWAKKILEWSESPEEALKTSIYLNDKYELDGRDPNGYAGCAWSIGGVHDRAWTERPVYGKIRYMNANGARRKFDVDAYIVKNN